MSEQFFLRQTIFCCIGAFIEAKARLVLVHGSNFWDFSAKRICFIHTNFLLQQTVFCCIGTFIEGKAELREFGGTRVSTRRWRIAGMNPSEDTQSFPIEFPFYLVLSPSRNVTLFKELS
jgi:hypothetical protein